MTDSPDLLKIRKKDSKECFKMFCSESVTGLTMRTGKLPKEAKPPLGERNSKRNFSQFCCFLSTCVRKHGHSSVKISGARDKQTHVLELCSLWWQYKPPFAQNPVSHQHATKTKAERLCKWSLTYVEVCINILALDHVSRLLFG